MTNSSVVGEKDKEDFQKTMEFVFEVLLLLIVSILGTIGNIWAIVLFSGQRAQLKFYRLMSVLAFFDLVYIVLSFAIFALPQLAPIYTGSGLQAHLLPLILPLAQMALTGSVYCTLALTLNRYLTVCHPFFTLSHVSSQPSAQSCAVVITIFSTVYNLPRFFEFVTVANREEDGDEVRWLVRPTSLRLNPTYISVYCICVNFVLMCLLPFCFLLILNALIVRALLEYRRESRSERGSASGKELVLAKVSLLITLFFVLCHSVKWVPNVYELLRLMREDRAWPSWVESVTHISHFSMTLNSSANFYIYCLKRYNLMPRLLGEEGCESREMRQLGPGMSIRKASGEQRSRHSADHEASSSLLTQPTRA